MTFFCSHPEGRFHDCWYVNARNELIPIAENLAMRDMKLLPEDECKPDRMIAYGAAFLRHMDELWKKRVVIG